MSSNGHENSSKSTTSSTHAGQSPRMDTDTTTSNIHPPITSNTQPASAHQRSNSAVSNDSKPRYAPFDTQSSSHRTSLPAQPRMPPLPSSSFFRPTKPSAFLDMSRRSSNASSLVGFGPPGTDGPGSIPLQQLTHEGTYESDGVSDVAGGRGSFADEEARQTRRSILVTYSREPLLPPLGHPRAGTAGSRGPTSLSRQGPDLGAGNRLASSASSARPLPPFSFGMPASYEPKAAINNEIVLDLVPVEESATQRWEPHPPANLPHPLSATPRVVHSGNDLMSTRSRPMRNFESHPSQNRFYLGGRILVGGDTPWAFLGTLTIILGLAGVWFGTTCAWWARHLSPALAAVGAYMFCLLLSLFFVTAFRDPGILPRNLDLDPPYPPTSPVDGQPRVPYPRDLRVRAGNVRVKYCTTCKTYRPPRSSHCKLCDNCVDDCDHHCQWVNNCVGRRNYTAFFTLILIGALTLVLVIVTAAVHLWQLTVQDQIGFATALREGAGSVVAFLIAVVVFWPVTALLSYHVRLLVLNVTTIEQIRTQAHKSLVPGPAPPNPFSHGSWFRNAMAVLCRPPGYSWMQMAAVATEDTRAINPAYTGGVTVAEAG